jgi:integrase/recombinase XerD
MVRGFARYAQSIDPAHEVRPKWLLPPGRRRPALYLFSDDKIVALMAGARRLRSALRAATTETVIGLLAVSGLRVGEILRLDRRDVAVDAGHLVVRDSKTGKSRLVPLRPSTIEALHRFSAQRDRLLPHPATNSMFVSAKGTRLGSGSLRTAFAETARNAGLAVRAGGVGPRLADLRHTFAVKTLTDWHHQGRDVQALLPLLSAYLGHVSPASTYWYFSACPHLLAAAATRLEGQAGAQR